AHRAVRAAVAAVRIGLAVQVAAALAVRLPEFVGKIGPRQSIPDLLQPAQRAEREHEGLVAVALGHVAVAAGDLLALHGADAADGPDLPACLAGSSSPTRAPHFCPA